MVSSCSVCSRAARHQCPQCATLYCGASCYIQTKAQHALICGQEKRQRDEETSKEDFIQLIEANDIEGVERAIKDVPTDYILMHYAKTPEMARLLVMHGGDVYAYVENGMVALDYMVRYMNIREFMAEATVPVPEWLADMIKRAQRDMASEPKRKHVYEITAQNPTLDDLRLAVFHGFVIVDESEYFLMCEHLLYRRYDNDSLVFWFGAGYTNFLYWISSFPFYYVNIGRIVEEAAHSASSFALLLFAPEHVYRQSKRPVNRMELFQMADSRILHVRLNVSDQFIPVTRYAKTREAGLFFGARGDRDFCGTFYYYEPESTTFLRAQNVLRAKNKTEAMSILTGGNFIPKIRPSMMKLLKKFENDSLMFTPMQMIDLLDSKVNIIGGINDVYASVAQDRPFYCGDLLGLDAAEDPYDQPICTLAMQAGYDVVILEKMVGGRQIVTEILDTRPREESFRNLQFLKK